MNKRAMIVIFSVVVVVLLVVLIWGISVRDGWNGWGAPPLRSSAGLEAGTMFEYPAADVRTLNLNLLSEEVIIVPADAAVVRVEQAGSADMPAEYRVRSGLQGDILVVQSSRRLRMSCGFDYPYDSTVRITVPKSALLELNIDILSGSVDVQDLQFHDVDIDAASGRIFLRNVSAENISAEAASGSVQIGPGTFRTLRCETASGDIDVEADVDGTAALSSMSGGQRFTGSCGEFDAEAASGDIDAEIRGAAAVGAESMSGSVNLKCADASRLSRIEADTASGDVTLTVPAGTALSLNYETMSGSLNLDEQSVLLGSSGIEVNVDTASGDLNIRSEGRSRPA